ncbi:MAG TPA: CHASE domain-containing protein, partial [Pseudomonadales bacterium]|nr:CHASE domain-containing protein [Pseudomonadales bacterium]
LQAIAGAWLLRRTSKQLPPETVKQTLMLIGVSLLIPLISSMLGVSSMTLMGVEPRENFATLVWTWWVGDAIGILLFTPALVIFGNRWINRQKVEEPVLWPFSSFLIGLTLFVFFAILLIERQQFNADLENDTEEMATAIEGTIKQHDMQSIIAIQALYSTKNDITRQQFQEFTRPFLNQFTNTAALTWAEYVTSDTRADFEKRMQAEGLKDYYIFETDASNQKVRSGARDEYFPVTYIEPIDKNKNMLGYDNGASQARLKAILQARDSGAASITEPIRLIQDRFEKIGILIMVPIYQNGKPIKTLEDRRQNFRGLAIGAFRVDDLVNVALSDINHYDIDLYLFDVTSPAKPLFLGFYSLNNGNSQPARTDSLPSLRNGIYEEKLISVGDHTWTVLVRPRASYMNSNKWIPWIVMLVGLMVTGA